MNTNYIKHLTKSRKCTAEVEHIPLPSMLCLDILGYSKQKMRTICVHSSVARMTEGRIWLHSKNKPTMGCNKWTLCISLLLWLQDLVIYCLLLGSRKVFLFFSFCLTTAGWITHTATVHIKIINHFWKNVKLYTNIMFPCHLFKL